MSRKFKNICIIDSVYTLLLYLIVNKCEINNTLFIFWKNTPENVVRHFTHKKRCNLPFVSIGNPYDIFGNYFKWLRFCLFYYSNHLQGIPVCGQDHLPMARLFLNYTSCSFTEYEDGLASYSKQPTKVNYYLLRKLIKTDSELRYGRSEKVRTIYLTNPNIDVPIEIIKKVHWINIKEQWEALSQTNKDMILSIFGITDLKLYKDIDTLIVTRPLSEEGMMTEEEKITYVRAIISKYKDGRFVIKPHYVEKTDYSVYFPNIEVIKEQFPLELLFLVIGDAIKNVVTIGHCSFENFIWQHYPKINYDILDINN